jgi:hypothetical protein
MLYMESGKDYASAMQVSCSGHAAVATHKNSRAPPHHSEIPKLRAANQYGELLGEFESH